MGVIADVAASAVTPAVETTAHGVVGPAAAAAETAATCPKCGSPLEPAARFCGACGARLEKPAGRPGPPAADPHAAVVQLVAAHDSELTSTLHALVWESKVRVDSVLGSAFAIAPGEFVTDSGLLAGARAVTLRTRAGRAAPARVVGSDRMIGVALLQADLDGVPPLPLRLDEPPRPGETLNALGFSDDTRAAAEVVMSAGVVSALHRGGAGIHPIEDYLQTDASLPRGLAGGPMLDARGRVVGMSTGLVLGSEVRLGRKSGIGFGVPADWIARALAWIRSGMPPRGWLGAHLVAADSERRERHRLPDHVKLFVAQVFPGSPAAAAGLRRGDGVVKVLGEEVGALPGLQLRLLSMKPGDAVTVEAVRPDGTVVMDLVLAPRPAKPRLDGIDALRYFGGLELVQKEGGRFVVASVFPGSMPALLKVAPGDVLLSVLSKKDWEHGARDNSRWRSVRNAADLEARLETAYSDLDFCLGLRFRARDGVRREVFLWTILTPTAAI